MDGGELCRAPSLRRSGRPHVIPRSARTCARQRHIRRTFAAERIPQSKWLSSAGTRRGGARFRDAHDAAALSEALAILGQYRVAEIVPVHNHVATAQEPRHPHHLRATRPRRQRIGACCCGRVRWRISTFNIHESDGIKHVPSGAASERCLAQKEIRGASAGLPSQGPKAGAGLTHRQDGDGGRVLDQDGVRRRD